MYSTPPKKKIEQQTPTRICSWFHMVSYGFPFNMFDLFGSFWGIPRGGAINATSTTLDHLLPGCIAVPQIACGQGGGRPIRRGHLPTRATTGPSKMSGWWFFAYTSYYTHYHCNTILVTIILYYTIL